MCSKIIFAFMLIVFIILLVIYCTHKNKSENFEDFDVFLVSMEKDKERRENVLKYIKPDYIYAVDGNKLNLDQLKKEGKITKDTKMKRGEIGCFLSHIHLIEKALKNKKNVLILEDDVKFEKETLNNIRKAIKNIPKDCEFMFLGHNYYEKYEEKEQYKKEPIKMIFGTHAYFVNIKNITQEKINKVYPINRQYDVIGPSFFKSYVVLPKVCEVEGKFASYSNTQNIK
jgi:GR25 family glycosyltransferase involved in LPS biosynthesis